jgi:hypothetical protein
LYARFLQAIEALKPLVGAGQPCNRRASDQYVGHLQELPALNSHAVE